MERLTLPHYGGDGHYMRCSEHLGCDGNCGECEDLDKIVNRLAYYEDMEEQGRLRIFPCEVGDKAYWVNGGKIKDCKVHRIQVNRRGMFLVLKSKVIHGAFNIGTIGHTVFFDRESAENALKGGAENA